MADMVIEPAGSDDDFDDDYGFSNNETMAGGSADDEKPYIRLLDHLPNVTKDAGDSFRLKCRVEGTLPIEFKWFLNEARVIRDRNKFTIKNKDYWSRLRVSDLHVLDSGFYRCEATNRKGTVKTTSRLNVKADMGKNRFNGDMGNHRNRNLPIDHINGGGHVAEKCQVYEGEACKKFLAHQKILMEDYNTEEDFLNVERELQAAIIVINNSSQVSENCKKVAQMASCYHNYQVCNSKPTIGKPQPQTLSICKKHCSLIEKDLCEEEYTIARDQHLVGPRPRLLPDCEQLDEHADPCLDILTDHFGEIKTDKTHLCYSGNGKNYRGIESKTENNNECEKWLVAKRKFPQYKSSNYMELTDNNFCRNPGGEKSRPWCFTKDLKEEYCNINKCPPGAYPQSSSSLNDNQLNSAAGSNDHSGDNDHPSSKDAGILGIPMQYVFMTAGIVGVLLIAIFIAGIYKCVQSKKERKKKISSMNGHCANGIRKPQQCGPAAEHQIEMMHLIGQRPPFMPKDELPNEISLANIRFMELLGEGQFGKVWKGELLGYSNDQEPIPVALKTLKDDALPRQKKDFEQETTIMARFRHPNIVELIGVCLQPQLMVFEFMMHGDLHEFLLLRSPYSQMESVDNERILLDHSDFLHIGTQIAAGMEYLAAHHYVHCDLAARNCLVTDRLVIKIGDFGLTRDVYASDYYLCQSQKKLPVRWMPPEAILFGKFNEMTDVWAFGVTVWEMYSYGTQPFYGINNAEVLDMVRQRCLLECPDNCPPRMYSLMVECWHETPSRRPRFAELHARLQTWSVVSSPAHSTVNASMPLQNGAIRSGSVLSGHSSGHLSNSGACNTAQQSTASIMNGNLVQSNALNGVNARNSPYGRSNICVPGAGVSPNTTRMNMNGGGYSVRNAATAYGYIDHGADSASTVS